MVARHRAHLHIFVHFQIPSEERHLGERLPYLHLSRRESQVMDALYRLGAASVAEVVRELSDEPGYNTIRNTLGILERKGYVTHRAAGKRYIYAPSGGAEVVQSSALRHVVQTFFQGSLPRERLLANADLRELRRFVNENPLIEFNSARNALQVKDCEGSHYVAHYRLTRAEAAALAE